jgi:hypothetical protein
MPSWQGIICIMFSRLSHSTLFKVVLVLLVLAVIEGGIWGYNYLQTLAPKSPADIVYAVTTPSGAAWYEIYNGRIASHPTLPGVSITGIARAGGNTFILGTSGTTSKLYSYNPMTKTYTSVYTYMGGALQGLSVDQNGLYAASTAQAGSTNPEVAIINLTDHSVATIATGYSPIIFGTTQINSTVAGKTITSPDGYMTVLFLQGKQVASMTQHIGEWSKVVNAYSALTAFVPTAQLVGDGASMFSFVDPTTSQSELWQLKTPDPLTVSPKTIYAKSSAQLVGFANGALVGLTLVPPSAKMSTISVEVSPLVDQTQKTSASSGSVTIPLKAAGTASPSFIGLIPS